MVQEPKKYADGETFNDTSEVMIYICAGTLYLFQISVIVAGIVILARLNKLNKAKPVCSMGICTDDTEERCVNCTIIMKNLA